MVKVLIASININIASNAVCWKTQWSGVTGILLKASLQCFIHDDQL